MLRKLTLPEKWGFKILFRDLKYILHMFGNLPLGSKDGGWSIDKVADKLSNIFLEFWEGLDLVFEFEFFHAAVSWDKYCVS